MKKTAKFKLTEVQYATITNLLWQVAYDTIKKSLECKDEEELNKLKIVHDNVDDTLSSLAKQAYDKKLYW